MGTSSEVLKGRADEVIAKLKDPPEGLECKAHGPMSEGILLLLEFKREELKNPKQVQDCLSFGALKATGPFAILTVVVGYLILKTHGVI